jgi:hypothetical protein
VAQSEVENRLSVLEMEREEGKRTISEQHSLIEQLETDLVNVQRFLPARTEAEVSLEFSALSAQAQESLLPHLILGRS